jgi:hypothetical protein
MALPVLPLLHFWLLPDKPSLLQRSVPPPTLRIANFNLHRLPQSVEATTWLLHPCKAPDSLLLRPRTVVATGLKISSTS